MNYFDSQSIAERYAAGRPDFHSNTISHIKAYLQITDKMDKALDIACGTGLSTKALLEVADHVIGTDISEDMLLQAKRSDQIAYLVAAAEKQPFTNEEFDLITVSSGVHWFDIDAFLAESHRLLKPIGHLALYENYIFDIEMEPEFKNWLKECYLKTYPSPPRNNAYKWDNENLNRKGLTLVHTEQFQNAVPMTKKSFILYLITQSNIIAAVSAGNSYKQIVQWLEEELTRFFPTKAVTRQIIYGNWIMYIQRNT